MYSVHSLVFEERIRNRRSELTKQLEEFLSVDLSSTSFTDTKQGRVDFLSRAMAMSATSHRKRRWCLKDPRASYFLQDYVETLPEARFVITIRDPRAVCRSYMSPTGFVVGRPANWIAGAERWKREVTAQLRLQNDYPDRVLILRYEEIITALEQQVDRICEFLGIRPEPAMKNYYKRNSSITIHDGNANILRPPDPSKIDAWRKSMTTAQTLAVESVALPLMESLGYSAVHPYTPVNQLSSIASRIHDRVVREYRWQRHKYKGRLNSV